MTNDCETKSAGSFSIADRAIQHTTSAQISAQRSAWMSSDNTLLLGFYKTISCFGFILPQTTPNPAPLKVLQTVKHLPPLRDDMTIFLLCHGDKATGDYHNPVLKHQDPPLGHKGREQSKADANFLIRTHISSIYVSSYIRTLQTAQPTAEMKQIQPIEDPRLNEIDNGYIDEMSEQEFEKACPDVLRS